MNRIYLISRASMAAIFFYHGLVPKLLFGNEQEVAMNDVLIPFVEKNFALYSSGVAEIIFAILILALYRYRVFNWICIGFGTVATIALIFAVPELFQNAFNPFSTNLALVSLATINLLANSSTDICSDFNSD